MLGYVIWTLMQGNKFKAFLRTTYHGHCGHLRATDETNGRCGTTTPAGPQAAFPFTSLTVALMETALPATWEVLHEYKFTCRNGAMIIEAC